MSGTQIVYVGLGSNLGDPLMQVVSAMRTLAESAALRSLRCSSCYASPPVGPPDQPDYVNAVVELETALPPGRLLADLQGIEDLHGRKRDGPRWGPRTLDLDLLVFGSRMIREDKLVVPHPELAHRAFVLVPLKEINAQLDIPGLGTVNALWRALGAPKLPRLTLP